MKHKIKCACGCAVLETQNRLVEVRTEYRHVDGSGVTHIRYGKRFMVRQECEAPFKREQNLMAALRALAQDLGEVAWWRRIPHAFAVYTAKYEHDVRLKGQAAARRDAWRCVWVTIAPEWLAARLTTRWRQSAPSVPATLAPGLPSAT